MTTPVKKSKDITGHRNGMLVAVSFAYKKNNRQYWKFKCDCGNYKIIERQNATNGNTKSCGCSTVKFRTQSKRFHGKSKSLIYKTWNGIMQRCTNKNHVAYKYYGGCGIRVCDRWKSFENFYADMGDKPDGMDSIDRINTNGDYEPSNCEWSTNIKQGRNTKRNRVIEYKGDRMCISEIAEKYNINQKTIISRLNAGISVEDAIETPIGECVLKK